MDNNDYEELTVSPFSKPIQRQNINQNNDIDMDDKSPEPEESDDFDEKTVSPFDSFIPAQKRDLASDSKKKQEQDMLGYSGKNSILFSEYKQKYMSEEDKGRLKKSNSMLVLLIACSVIFLLVLPISITTIYFAVKEFRQREVLNDEIYLKYAQYLINQK